MSQRTFFKRSFQYKIKRVSQKKKHKKSWILSKSVTISQAFIFSLNTDGAFNNDKHIYKGFWSYSYCSLIPCLLLLSPLSSLSISPHHFCCFLRQGLMMLVWNILCSPGLVVLWVCSLIQVVTAIFLLIPCKKTSSLFLRNVGNKTADFYIH